MLSAFHITLFGELLCKEDLKWLSYNLLFIHFIFYNTFIYNSCCFCWGEGESLAACFQQYNLWQHSHQWGAAPHYSLDTDINCEKNNRCSIIREKSHQIYLFWKYKDWIFYIPENQRLLSFNECLLIYSSLF